MLILQDLPFSLRVPVHITVTDVNEFAPVFSQAAYVKAVDEGRIYDEIVRVEATDRDCTPRYGDVCKYEILTDRSQPFTIDNEGGFYEDSLVLSITSQCSCFRDTGRTSPL